MTFTRCINVYGVNEAMPQGLLWLANRGVEESSRNGSVLVSPDPVITCYSKPEQRVLFSPLRDANPFFHLMEGLWMLAGRNDVAWITQFNSGFPQFSDDGVIFHGAYGYRWRQYFGYDQLDTIINELRANPTTRRAVLAMWDGGCWGENDNAGDLNTAIGGGKDVPCNTNVFFRIVNGKLNMMINCRSNDIVWGAYGANAVHMSMMQEYVARCVGVPVGAYYQNSFNYHLYLDVCPLDKIDDLASDISAHNQYYHMGLGTTPLMSTDKEVWDADLERFMGGDMEPEHYADRFFTDCALPMFKAWQFHKSKDYQRAHLEIAGMNAPDWHHAARQWVAKRARKAA